MGRLGTVEIFIKMACSENRNKSLKAAVVN
jgi:hypothetical protein